MRALHELAEHTVPLHPKELRDLLALVPRFSLRGHWTHLLAQVLHVSSEAVQIRLGLGAVGDGAVTSRPVAADGGAERDNTVLQMLDAACILPRPRLEALLLFLELEEYSLETWVCTA